MGDSWSGVRKRLEQDLLCDALKGRLNILLQSITMLTTNRAG